jgi:hypothetical protein
MEELAKALDEARLSQENVDGKNFLPEAMLYTIVSEEAIRRTLAAAPVPPHDIRDLTTSVLQGARKCFAILVFIGHPARISSFFTYDTLLTSCPDDRLPYNLQALEHIFGEGTESLIAKRFSKTQWEFAIPIMHQQTLHRELDKRVILPILERNHVGRGAKGVAWKIKLHKDCHRLPLKGQNTVSLRTLLSPIGTRAIIHCDLTHLHRSYKNRYHANPAIPMPFGKSLRILLFSHT